MFWCFGVWAGVEYHMSILGRVHVSLKSRFSAIDSKFYVTSLLIDAICHFNFVRHVYIFRSTRLQQRIEQCDAQRRRFIAQQLELSAQVSNGGCGSNGNDKDDGFGFDATAKAEDRARLRMQVRASRRSRWPIIVDIIRFYHQK